MPLKGLLKSAVLVISSKVMAVEAPCVNSTALKQFYAALPRERNGFTAAEEHAGG